MAITNLLATLIADEKNPLGNGSEIGTPGTVDTANTGTLQSNIIVIINWVMGIIGIICVIVIIIGGIQYMTSAGDTNKVTKAKNTILYGLIGLIIIILAAVIVNTVINGVIGNG